jgi:hypothetical protein
MALVYCLVLPRVTPRDVPSNFGATADATRPQENSNG